MSWKSKDKYLQTCLPELPLRFSPVSQKVARKFRSWRMFKTFRRSYRAFPAGPTPLDPTPSEPLPPGRGSEGVGSRGVGPPGKALSLLGKSWDYVHNERQRDVWESKIRFAEFGPKFGLGRCKIPCAEICPWPFAGFLFVCHSGEFLSNFRWECS